VSAVAAIDSDVSTVAANISDVNNFADTYFVSATEPSSPTVGDLWFDTTNQIMKVYTDSGFANAGSSVNGTSERQNYVVGTPSGSYDGSTTVFPATYDAGFVDVYLNGVKLVVGTDFTATNGTSITLASAATSGDAVNIIGYGTFELSNFSINDANDVSTGGVTDGQVLAYNNSTGDWEPTTIAADAITEGNSSVEVVDTGTGHVAVTVDGSETARFDANGRLGIGTTSPTSTIQVNNGNGISLKNNSAPSLPVSTEAQLFEESNGVIVRGQNNGTSSNFEVRNVSNTTSLAVTGGNDLKFNSGFGSVAVAYGVRAWVNFDGEDTVAIRGDGNVSSITDNGTGNYTVNFSNAMPDNNYAVAVNGYDRNVTGVGDSGEYHIHAYNKATGSFIISTVNFQQSSTTSAQDFEIADCAVFR